MGWQFSISFNSEQMDRLREKYEHESTKDLKDTLKEKMKDAALEGPNQ